MPFSMPVKKEIKNDCASLQVQKQRNKVSEKNIKNKFFIWKRVCLFASSKLWKTIKFFKGKKPDNIGIEGSVTIEAAISIILFMMMILFVENFMMIVNKEMDMQIQINNTARQIAKNMFYVSIAEELSDNQEKLEGIKTKGEAINKALAAYAMVGADISDSNIENGIVDMVVKYQAKIPFLNKIFPMCQRALVKDWSGVDITQEGEKVYITNSGTVYHRSKDCSHLVIHISKTTVSGATLKRNDSGGKYSACEHCINKEMMPDESVFITEDGNRYHISLQCQALTRRVMEVDISMVGDRRLCSACREE